MKLYELSAEYLSLMEAIDAGEIPEEAIEDTLEAVQGDISVKIDNIACIIKNLEAEKKAISDERKRLEEREKAKSRACEKLSEYLRRNMLSLGMDKYESTRNKITFRKSSRIISLDDEKLITYLLSYHPECLTLKKPEINKTEIRKALNNGENIPFATIEESINMKIG